LGRVAGAVAAAAGPTSTTVAPRIRGPSANTLSGSRLFMESTYCLAQIPTNLPGSF
jgi:hypothetical protein